jgi:hypothetical protein
MGLRSVSSVGRARCLYNCNYQSRVRSPLANPNLDNVNYLYYKLRGGSCLAPLRSAAQRRRSLGGANSTANMFVVAQRQSRFLQLQKRRGHGFDPHIEQKIICCCLVAQLVERGANIYLLRQGNGFETRRDLMNTVISVYTAKLHRYIRLLG